MQVIHASPVHHLRELPGEMVAKQSNLAGRHRKTNLFAPLKKGQGVAHKLKGVPHAHVIPNGERLAVERITTPLARLEGFTFKATAMPVPTLLVVAAPKQQKS